MNPRTLLTVLCTLPASAQVIAADEVVVSVGGYAGDACNDNEAIVSKHNAGVAFTLDVGVIRQTYPGFTHIRIDASSVSDSIGRVTLTNVGANDPDVLLLIADCLQESFPSVPGEFGFTLPSRRAATNWAGLVIGSNVDVSKINLAVRLAGNITNTVTTGRVFSMIVDGSVNADVTAENTDSLTDPSDDSISFLSAGNAILGHITATQGSINTIWCGVNNASSGGIDGDIKAENGLIQDILSTGPIGANRPSNNKVKVRAGYGIIQTTCRYVNAQGAVLARNMTAEVRADVQADPDPGLVREEQHGKIEKFYVSGNYAGEIKGWVVRPLSYP